MNTSTQTIPESNFRPTTTQDQDTLQQQNKDMQDQTMTTMKPFCSITDEWVLSKFNGTSTPKGSYCAKTADYACNVNWSRYSLSTALCESIRYQAKSEQNVRQDLIPRVHHGEAALCTPPLRMIRTSAYRSTKDLPRCKDGTMTRRFRTFPYIWIILHTHGLTIFQKTRKTPQTG